jgi:hypothetical protein
MNKEGSDSGLIEVLTRHFLEVLKKSTNMFVKIAGNPVENRAQDVWIRSHGVTSNHSVIEN